jgi:DNA ligase-1
MKSLPTFVLALLFITSLALSQVTANTDNNIPIKKTHQYKPTIQQGVHYKSNVDITQYWVSEKLDGMRGYWDGKTLISRQGHIILAPKWFTKNWPVTKMDGELWINRNSFQALMSCIKTIKNVEWNDENKTNNCWHHIRFMMFDLPKHKGDFNHRIQVMTDINSKKLSPYLAMVPQFTMANNAQLHKKLAQITANNGEGLMLHLGNSFYTAGRTVNIMKLKISQDAEAKVIAHLAGKGKYENMLGSIKVITREGVTFKIGSGFTDKDRRSPPPLGSIITFKYNGKTQDGIPRFARYFRERVE